MASGENIMKQSGTEGSHNASAGPSASHGKKLCDGVYSLYEPEGQPEVEIVFIHGLQLGHSEDAYEHAYWTTWLARDGSQDNCWPQTWLAAVYPKARVLSISYNASRALRSYSSGAMDLHPFGESLVQEMVFSGVDIGQHGCPVVFVCHCLGGLIAKEIVVLGHERFKGDKRIEKLLKNIKAFVFYATPHGGSELVKMNPDLARLNSTFEAIQRKVYNNKCKFRVVAESHETSSNWFSSSMIVEEHSVRYAGFDRVIHVAADHFNVCKPETVRSTSFLHLTGCIEEVVAEYQSNQDKISGLPSLVIGIDSKLVELREKLKERPIVGLVGMGGVGKTTLSKALFNTERGNYDMCCYLEDVKSHSNIVDVQKQLLRELCDEEWKNSEEPKDYDLRIVRQCIQTKKVLVVIDDVGTEKNLKALQVEAFQHGCSGSRLIVTCRNKAILSDYMLEGDKIEVEMLDNDQSKELFLHYAFHAFNDVYEIEREERGIFEREAVKIVRACGGLPLSLEVIGQHLRKRNHLHLGERLDVWKEALRRLKEAISFEGYSNHDEKLWSTLKISYDDLDDLEKGFFLEFACILCDGEDLNRYTIDRIWENRGGVQTLIDSSLIKVVKKESYLYDRIDCAVERDQSDMNGLMIHDQLRDMGRWIARDLAKNNVPKYMKLMGEENDVLKFFEDHKDSITLEGLCMMNIKRSKHQMSYVLRILMSKISLKKHTNYYPNLRLFDLSRSNINVVTLVEQVCQIHTQNLRWLSLNFTPIRKKHLKILNASLETLCVLHMRKCDQLVELPSSIGDLSSLKELDLRFCRYLRSLPKTIGLKLGNLQVLILNGCGRIKELPEAMANLVQLLELHLSYCIRLKRLPSGLGNLKLLKVLNLNNCQSLHTMCEFDTKMHHLHTLNLNSCGELRSFKSLGNLYRLRFLDLQFCLKLKELHVEESGRNRLPDALRNLVGLQTLHVNWSKCERLPECIGDLVSLRDLSLEWCEELVELPSSLGRLSELRTLNLGFCRNLERLPESLGLLTQLRTLDLLGCEKLEGLPDSVLGLTQLTLLEIGICTKLTLKEEVRHALTERGCKILDRWYQI
ncbi:hypothetical protein KC19_8G083000 [Ceratodon purpureus]|uniref:NB-ARC domain-containing protein n=1 Tax=Ceratodon purpureus TaxID=3225 RepID=A0A8T0H165_CERPU|nr:hypothetical protein KC19_8G083000 [Ceratodon purpureus]